MKKEVFVPCLWRVIDYITKRGLIEKAEREVTVNGDDAWVIIDRLSTTSSLLSSQSGLTSPVVSIRARKIPCQQPQQQPSAECWHTQVPSPRPVADLSRFIARYIYLRCFFVLNS